MREIKFRCWFENEMYYWDMLKTDSPCLDYLKNAEIMQFTGLCDKNEKEIYDGDISNSVYGIGKVYWCNMTAKFMFEFDTDCTDLFSICSGQDKKYFEVIGNIYENGNLLHRAEGEKT